LALLIIRYDKKTAQVDAVIIGVLSIVWGVVYKWIFYDSSYKSTGLLGWVELTDYLVVALAIPTFVAILNGASKRI